MLIIYKKLQFAFIIFAIQNLQAEFLKILQVARICCKNYLTFS